MITNVELKTSLAHLLSLKGTFTLRLKEIMDQNPDLTIAQVADVLCVNPLLIEQRLRLLNKLHRKVFDLVAANIISDCVAILIMKLPKDIQYQFVLEQNLDKFGYTIDMHDLEFISNKIEQYLHPENKITLSLLEKHGKVTPMHIIGGQFKPIE